MKLERSKSKNWRHRKWMVAAAIVQSLPLFLAACGQNAHVTRPDGAPEATPFVSPQQPGSGGQVTPIQPSQPLPSRMACPSKVEKRFPLRAMTAEEIRMTELPYPAGSMEMRTLGTEPVLMSYGASGGCGRRAHAQVVFAADLRGLPPRHTVARVNRMALEMKLIRPTTAFDGSELMCLLDERVCSGGSSAMSCGANREFWNAFGSDEIRYMNRYFVDQLKNDQIWKRRTAGPGKLTNDFEIDFRQFLSGSRYPDVESFLYLNTVNSGGLVDRTLRIAMVDDLVACSGEVVIEMEIDACGGSL